MKRILVLLALVAGTLLVDDAFAGKKPKGDAAAATATEEGGKKAADPYAIPEMKPTNIPEFDSFFDQGKAPIESLVTTRKRIDMAQGRINTSMGLAEGVTFEDSVAEFKKRVETKAKIGLKKGKLPRFTTADAVPDDVQKMVDEFNASLDEMEAAMTQLESIKPELATLAGSAVEMPGKAPEAAKSAGLGPTESVASAKATSANTKTLTEAKDESEKLYATLEGITTALEANFGPAVDGDSAAAPTEAPAAQ